MRFHPVLPVAALLAASPAFAQTPAPVEEIVVTGRRGGVPAYERPYGPTVLDAATLGTSPQRRLDEALRAVPGFSLFRRSGSRTANPTTQGVSLRGIGPNGAGRTLVLLDGMPVNDPFGGWVHWSRLPTPAAERVVITRGGGAGPWGNVALAGTIRIETRLHDGATLDLAAGSDATVQATGEVGRSVSGTSLGLRASAFRTDGVPLVRADRRGPVDIAAAAESYALDATAQRRFGPVTATARLSAFREHRGNGTPYTENATEALEGSLRLVGDGALPFEALVYARDWGFESTFSGVNDARTAETPALDQTEVPSDSLGGVLQLGVLHTATHRTDIGLDLRWTAGETRERFFRTGDRFTRDRVAGGEQTVAGLFAEHAWTPDTSLTLSAGARLDWWRNADGRRTERSIDTGAAFRDDRFADETGRVLNGRLGADWQATPVLALRAAVYTGFRLPTLNELYRPFRIGDDITEANPALAPERLAGGEVGVRLTPTDALALSATLFRVDLENAVDNVTLTDRPGLFAPLGVFVPAGGTLAQRRNLDRIEVTGIEADLRWRATERLSLALSYLWSDATVAAAAGFPDLVGNRVAQSPRHQGTADATWTPIDALTLRLQLRAAGEAFEDGRNSRTLAPYVLADLYAGWDVTDTLRLTATVENLADRTVETGRRGDGLTSIGPGRQVLLGLSARW